jgi:hypothetical protein
MAAVILVTSLASCGGGGGGGAPATYTVGVNISGLSGSGLVLQLNAGSNLAITAAGNATFATAIASGTNYHVTVKTQPTSPSQTCTVANGSGAIAAANVTGIVITCVTVSETVGVTVSGLTGSGMVLQLNGGNDLAINADGTASFATAIDSGASYAVTVKTQPMLPAQICTVANGSGTVAAANVTGVSITCVAAYGTTVYRSVLSIGGTGVLGYPANSSGPVSMSTGYGQTDFQQRIISALTTDSLGYVYVSASVNPNLGYVPNISPAAEVLVLAPTLKSGLALVRTITPTGFTGASAIAVDGAGNVYLSTSIPTTGQGQPTSFAILEFAAGASGAAVPIRTINFATGLGCQVLAVDAKENIICVPHLPSGANMYGPNDILLFASGQSGNATPARTISLGGNLQIVDLSLDPSGNIYVTTAPNVAAGATGILMLQGGVDGTDTQTPLAGIIASLPAGSSFSSLRFDAAGNLYVLGGSQTGTLLTRFTSTPNGFASPTAETLINPIPADEEPFFIGFAVF